MFELEKKNGKLIAVIDDNGRFLTYKDLSDFSCRLNHLLKEKSLVFLLCNNSLDCIKLYVGCLEMNVVPLLINANVKRTYLDKLIDMYNPNYIMLPKGSANKTPYIEFETYSIVLNSMEKIPLNRELSLLLETSGSTGSSKLVRLSAINIISNAKSIIDYLNIDENDRPLVNLPMNYSYGMSIINSHLLAGSTVLLTNHTVVQKKLWEFVEYAQATSISGVPYTYEVLKKFGFLKLHLPYLKTLTQAGGRLSQSLHTEFGRFAESKKKKFIVMYGQTEASPRMAYLPSDCCLTNVGCIGVAIPSGSLYIAGDSIDKYRTKTEGELIYEGPNVSLGYANTRDDLLKGDENRGVLRTGDIAIKNKNGLFRITGRKSRFLKIHGVRINLDECERIIMTELNIKCICLGNDEGLCIYLHEREHETAATALLSRRIGVHYSLINTKCIKHFPRNLYGKIMLKNL